MRLGLWGRTPASETLNRELALWAKLRSRQMKMYYAHVMGLYGSDHEQRMRQIIKETFGAVECPNQPHHDVGFSMFGMEYFDTRVVDHVDGLVFEPLADGMIGSGVAWEVREALRRGKPVYVLTKIGPDRWQITGWLDGLDETKVLSREETRERNKVLRSTTPAYYLPLSQAA